MDDLLTGKWGGQLESGVDGCSLERVVDGCSLEKGVDGCSLERGGWLLTGKKDKGWTIAHWKEG